MSNNLLNCHFDTSKPVELLTDASRQNGLGFALCQGKDQDKLFIVTCGSKSLTPTQQRYATIELECLAIVWAMDKCNFYQKGLPIFYSVNRSSTIRGGFQKDNI